MRLAKLVPVCRGPGDESNTRRATSYVLIEPLKALRFCFRWYMAIRWVYCSWYFTKCLAPAREGS